VSTIGALTFASVAAVSVSVGVIVDVTMHAMSWARTLIRFLWCWMRSELPIDFYGKINWFLVI
jgi:hypothetical protein